MKYSIEKGKINKFEFWLIVINTITFFVWIFFNNNWLGWISWASYFFYMISLYLYSVGKWQTHLFNIISYLFYIYICFYYFYLGEIISTFVTIIISFSLIFVWRKNQNKNEQKKQIKENKVSGLEVLISSSSIVIFFFIFYYLFKVSGSNEIILNAIIAALMPITYYFSYRINKIVFVYSFLSIILYMFLWLKTLLLGESVASIYIIGSIFSIIWTLYSLYNWKELQK